MLPYICFISSLFVCMTMVNTIPYRKTIYDLGHNIIPQISETKLPDIILTIHVINALLTLQSYDSVLYQISLFYFTRGSLLGLTILPSLKEYRPFSVLGSIGGGYNDYLPFSGHTGLSHIISNLLYQHYGFYIYIFDITLIYLLIAMRKHYTIEIFVSLLFVRYASMLF